MYINAMIVHIGFVLFHVSYKRLMFILIHAAIYFYSLCHKCGVK